MLSVITLLTKRPNSIDFKIWLRIILFVGNIGYTMTFDLTVSRSVSHIQRKYSINTVKMLSPASNWTTAGHCDLLVMFQPNS